MRATSAMVGRLMRVTRLPVELTRRKPSLFSGSSGSCVAASRPPPAVTQPRVPLADGSPFCNTDHDGHVEFASAALNEGGASDEGVIGEEGRSASRLIRLTVAQCRP